MKTFSKLILSAMALWGVCACGDDNNVVLPEAVTAAKVAGTWKLTEWNGEEMNDDRYCYIVLDRKELTIGVYQNFDSFTSRHLTGSFTLNFDRYTGVNTIEGVYDHLSGFWRNNYVISAISDASMTWVVEGDETDVSVYTRCESIPDKILNDL